MNYYKVRIEEKKDEGYEEIAVFYTKQDALDCIKRVMKMKPYHYEICRGKKTILTNDKFLYRFL
jgi:hypothetical protein